MAGNFRFHKYNAKRKKCMLDHSHPSMLEADYCDQLSMLKKAGEIKDFIYGHKFEFYVNGVHVGNHKPDFLVTKLNNCQEVHECKGVVLPDFVLRKNLFEALYPSIPYILIKSGGKTWK